jgi:hypothetical protein
MQQCLSTLRCRNTLQEMEVPVGHPSMGQIRQSTTLADWAQNAAVMEHQRGS